MAHDAPTALNLPMVDPLPEATQKYFDVCQQKLGMVPNVLRAYAFDIDKLNAFAAMYNDLMLGGSNLSKLEREMIAVVVSSVNKCYYCLTAHGAAVRELSGNPILGEQMVMNWRVADLDARQTAMLAFAENLTVASAKTSITPNPDDLAHWPVLAGDGKHGWRGRIDLAAIGATYRRERYRP